MKKIKLTTNPRSKKAVNGSLNQLPITISLHMDLILYPVCGITYISVFIYKLLGIPQIISVNNYSLLLRNYFELNFFKSFSVSLCEIS